jgi:hypothetical protein
LNRQPGVAIFEENNERKRERAKVFELKKQRKEREKNLDDHHQKQKKT